MNTDHVRSRILDHSTIDSCELDEQKSAVMELVSDDDPGVAESSLAALERLELTEVDRHEIARRVWARTYRSDRIVLTFYAMWSNYQRLDSDEVSLVESTLRESASPEKLYDLVSSIVRNMRMPESAFLTDAIYRYLEGSPDPYRELILLRNLSQYLHGDRLNRCFDRAEQRVANDRVSGLAFAVIKERLTR